MTDRPESPRRSDGDAADQDPTTDRSDAPVGAPEVNEPTPDPPAVTDAEMATPPSPDADGAEGSGDSESSDDGVPSPAEDAEVHAAGEGSEDSTTPEASRDAAPSPPEMAESDDAELVSADDDTDEIPVVAPPESKPAMALWLVAGAAVGLGALVLFTGGLGSSDDSGTSTVAETDAAPQLRPEAVSPAPATTAPAPTAARSEPTLPPVSTATSPDRPAPTSTSPSSPPGAFTVVLRGRNDVFIEVKERSETGDTVFAGTVGNGVTKRLTSRVPLWLNVSWAPNAIVVLNGRSIPLTGGTELYRVQASGVRRITDD